MITGTASAIDIDEDKPWDEQSAQLHFKATVIPEDFTDCQILAISRTASALVGSEFATLFEATTAFGRRMPGEESQKCGRSEYLRLYFPLHISNLRAAAKTEKPLQERLGLEQGNIPVPPDERKETDFIVPTYSPRTVAYDEQVLSNILSTLHREGLRYVHVYSSDAKDLIFLVHQIEQHCPNTVIITTWTDLLFLHSDVNPDLRGTLVFSAAPLFNATQRWTADNEPDRESTERLQFPFDDAEGEYNATLALLGYDAQKNMLDYTEPRLWPDENISSEPVLWLSIVGIHDFWPIGYVRPGDTPDSQRQKAANYLFHGYENASDAVSHRERTPQKDRQILMLRQISTLRFLYPAPVIASFGAVDLLCLLFCWGRLTGSVAKLVEKVRKRQDLAS